MNKFKPHCLLLLSLLAGPALAQTQAPVDEAEAINDVRYVVGAVLSNGPIYFGQKERGTGLRPMFALRWGKVRFSSSGAGGLIGEGNAGGASADVFSSQDWKVRLGLRIDRGRKIEDDSSNRLEDLPRVRGTLRGRLMVSHALSADSSLSLSVAPDLLGRDGGTTVQLGYYKRLATPAWLTPLGGQWSLGAGLGGGDDRYMNSYFGILPGAKRFAAYKPEGGLRNGSLGLGWQRSFGEKQAWVLFGGANLQRMLGPAADAPFIERKTTWSADMGLAYRH
jgi:MipA family protein